MLYDKLITLDSWCYKVFINRTGSHTQDRYDHNSIHNSMWDLSTGTYHLTLLG